MVRMPRRFCRSRISRSQFGADFCVERRERFVKQKQLGIHCHRPRESDPLLLAAGELERVAVRKVRQADQVEQFGDPAGPFGERPSPDLEPVADILGDIHVGKQRIRLEDDAEPSLTRRDARQILVIEKQLPAIGHRQTGNQPEQSRLPAARRPEKTDEFRRCGRERDVVEGGDAPETLGEIFEFQPHRRCCQRPISFCQRSRIASRSFADLAKSIGSKVFETSSGSPALIESASGL